MTAYMQYIVVAANASLV